MPENLQYTVTFKTRADGDGAQKTAADIRNVQATAQAAVPRQRNLAAATLEASRAFEDMQYGMRGALNNLPGLLQMLGAGAGLTGVLSIAAVGVSIFAKKLEEMEQAAKQSGEAAKEAKEKMLELASVQAGEEFDRWLGTLDLGEQTMQALADAEVRRLGTAEAVAAADRRGEAAMATLTAAAREYLSALHGIESVEDRLAAKKAEIAREADNATAKQTLRMDQARAAYEATTDALGRLNDRQAEMIARRNELEAQVAADKSFADLTRASGDEGRAQDLEIKLEALKAELAGLKSELADIPGEIQNLTVQARTQATAIDAAVAEATAEINAITQEAAAKTSAADLSAAVEKNKELTSTLSTALADYQAQTPAQAQAAANVAAAVADGKLTTQELASLSASLQQLGPAFQATIQGNTAQVTRLVQLVQQLQADQRSNDALVNGLLNRR